MNYELEKKALIEMIEEANNLAENELEVIEDTDILVKKGKTKEFENRAWAFYQDYKRENNIIELAGKELNPTIEVYNILNKEITQELDEHLISKAYDLSKLSSSIEKFDINKTMLLALEKNYNLHSQEISKIYTSGKILERSEDIKRLNDELLKISEDIKHITDDLNSIRTTINDNLIKELKDQMRFIHEDTLRALKGTEVAYASDGVSILKSRLEEYNSLHYLIQLLEIAKNKELNDITSIDNIMFISKEQIENAKTLMSVISLFKYLKSEEKNIPVTEEKELNVDEVIAETNYSEYIPTMTREDKLNINRKLIVELYDYLDILGKKISTQNSMTNLDLRMTKDGTWVFLASDMKEAENILSLISLLKKQEEKDNNLIEVNDFAYITESDLEEFKRLISDTSFFKEASLEQMPIVIETPQSVIALDDIKESKIKYNKIKEPLIEFNNEFITQSPEINPVIVEVINDPEIVALESPQENIIDLTKTHEERKKVFTQIKEILKNSNYILEDNLQNGPLAIYKNTIEDKTDLQKYEALYNIYCYLAQVTLMDYKEEDLINVNGVYIYAYNEQSYKSSLETLKQLDINDIFKEEKTDDIINNTTLENEIDPKLETEKLEQELKRIESLLTKVETTDSSHDLLNHYWSMLYACVTKAKENPNNYFGEGISLGNKNLVTSNIEGLIIPLAYKEEFIGYQEEIKNIENKVNAFDELMAKRKENYGSENQVIKEPNEAVIAPVNPVNNKEQPEIKPIKKQKVTKIRKLKETLQTVKETRKFLQKTKRRGLIKNIKDLTTNLKEAKTKALTAVSTVSNVIDNTVEKFHTRKETKEEIEELTSDSIQDVKPLNIYEEQQMVQKIAQEVNSEIEPKENTIIEPDNLDLEPVVLDEIPHIQPVIMPSDAEVENALNELTPEFDPYQELAKAGEISYLEQELDRLRLLFENAKTIDTQREIGETIKGVQEKLDNLRGRNNIR